MCIATVRKLLSTRMVPDQAIELIVKSIYSISLSKGEILDLEPSQTFLVSVDYGLIGEFFHFGEEREICSSLFTTGTIIPFKRSATYYSGESSRLEALQNSSIFVVPRKSNFIENYLDYLDIAADDIYKFFVSYSRELILLRAALSAEDYMIFFILIYCTSSCKFNKKSYITADLLSKVTGCTRQYANKVVFNLCSLGALNRESGKFFINNKELLIDKVDPLLYKKFYKPCCSTILVWYMCYRFIKFVDNKNQIINNLNAILSKSDKIKKILSGRITINDLNYFIISLVYEGDKAILSSKMLPEELLIEFYFLYLKTFLDQLENNSLTIYQNLAIIICGEIKHLIDGSKLNEMNKTRLDFISKASQTLIKAMDKNKIRNLK